MGSVLHDGRRAGTVARPALILPCNQLHNRPVSSLPGNATADLHIGHVTSGSATATCRRHLCEVSATNPELPHLGSYESGTNNDSGRGGTTDLGAGTSRVAALVMVWDFVAHRTTPPHAAWRATPRRGGRRAMDVEEEPRDEWSYFRWPASARVVVGKILSGKLSPCRSCCGRIMYSGGNQKRLANRYRRVLYNLESTSFSGLYGR